MTDAQIIEWLEDQAKKSRTGISFDYVNLVEDGRVVERGFRFMRRHYIGDPCKTLREAIENAIQNQHSFTYPHRP